MACGGCGGARLSSPLTSGDFATAAEPVTAETASFKVITDDYEAGDPASGVEESGVTYHASYRAARIHQVQHGGKLRAT
jgi:hypothetical protein